MFPFWCDLLTCVGSGMGGRGRPRKRVNKVLITELEELKIGSGIGKSPNGGNLHGSAEKQTPTCKDNQLDNQGSENTPITGKGKSIAGIAESSTCRKVDNGDGTTCNAGSISGVKARGMQENPNVTKVDQQQEE